MPYYKVSETQHSDKGFGFDLLNGKEVPLVHFLYEREADVFAALEQVRVAVANAKLIKPSLGT